MTGSRLIRISLAAICFSISITPHEMLNGWKFLALGSVICEDPMLDWCTEIFQHLSAIAWYPLFFSSYFFYFLCFISILILSPSLSFFLLSSSSLCLFIMSIIYFYLSVKPSLSLFFSWCLFCSTFKIFCLAIFI